MIVTIALQILSAFLLWTLTEYMIHRFLGHGRFANLIRSEHQKHHRKSTYFSPFWRKALVAIGISSALMLITFPILGMFGALVFSASYGFFYSLYEFVHYRIHVAGRTWGLGLRVRRHHLYHHYVNPKFNHGVTTGIWDRVFSTYQHSGIIPVPKRLATEWLKQDYQENEAKKYGKYFRLV